MTAELSVVIAKEYTNHLNLWAVDVFQCGSDTESKISRLESHVSPAEILNRLSEIEYGLRTSLGLQFGLKPDVNCGIAPEKQQHIILLEASFLYHRKRFAFSLTLILSLFISFPFVCFSRRDT
jgi:hypothetical protein